MKKLYVFLIIVIPLAIIYHYVQYFFIFILKGNNND